MLLDDRRIVLTLEAICWCTAAMVFFQQTDFPSAIAILPLLMAVLIHVEYPPAGSGVGTVAEAAPGLTFEEDHAKHAAEVFDKEGGLLRGHAYVLTFLRKTPGSLKQMPRLARMPRGARTSDQADQAGLLLTRSSLALDRCASGFACTGYEAACARRARHRWVRRAVRYSAAAPCTVAPWRRPPCSRARWRASQPSRAAPVTDRRQGSATGATSAS
jgi:hypothetical protein